MSQSETSFLTNLSSSVDTFADTLAYPGPYILFGFFAFVVVSVLFVFWLTAHILTLSDRFQRKVAMTSMANDTTPGNKIMIAGFSGFTGMSMRGRISDALELYLPEFNFGADFYLGSCPLRIRSTGPSLSRADLARLQGTLNVSGADLIIWRQRGDTGKGASLCFATAEMLSSGQERGFILVHPEKPLSDWDEADLRAIAYVAGKRLRPALGKPGSFKPERLAPIIESMGHILAADQVLSGKAQAELEDDYAGGALHLGAHLENTDWLEASVIQRLQTLEQIKQSDDRMRWAQTKIGLGRAMTLQCGQTFDPQKLTEAMTHIREGVDAVKSDPHLQLAETGFEALKLAEKLLADRRKFSVRWTV